MFRVLACDEIGMGLTESLAMTPAASVSGFYLAHPDAAYFNVGKIGEDQLRRLGAAQRARRGAGAALAVRAALTDPRAGRAGRLRLLTRGSIRSQLSDLCRSSDDRVRASSITGSQIARPT